MRSALLHQIYEDGDRGLLEFHFKFKTVWQFAPRPHNSDY